MLQGASGSSTAREGRVSAAVGAIARLIHAEGCGPGDRRSSVPQPSRDLDVWRAIVREALLSLAAMHLTRSSGGRRATVARLDHAALASRIERDGRTHRTSVQQVHDVRRRIEQRTVALAALRRSDTRGRRTPAQGKAMGAATGRMVERVLHLAVAKAPHQPGLTPIVGAFEGGNRRTWPIGWPGREDDAGRTVMLDLRGALAGAIVAGDPRRASEPMARHFDERVRAPVVAAIP